MGDGPSRSYPDDWRWFGSQTRPQMPEERRAMEKPPEAEPWEKIGVTLLALLISVIFFVMMLASIERLIAHSRDDGRHEQAHTETDPRLTDWVQAGSAFFSFVLTISILGVY